MRFSSFFALCSAALALAAPVPSSQSDIVLRVAKGHSSTGLSDALESAQDFRSFLKKELASISGTGAVQGSPEVAAKYVGTAVAKIASQAQTTIGSITPLVLKLDLPLNDEDTITLVALAQEIQDAVTESRDTVVQLLRGLSRGKFYTIRTIILESSGPVVRTIKDLLGPFGGFLDTLLPPSDVLSGSVDVFSQAISNVLGGS
ncbi:hypothetical protein CDV31_016920 [Fusarium ambrosium]|uniref:Cell wall protein n=1 Tax=Fusarium ambrosium TaxID=131363 RepID=A0A428RYE1_9HYPO|nr:hypothetical protein CDV31_016920 [Fusarium ambrosium]